MKRVSAGMHYLTPGCVDSAAPTDIPDLIAMGARDLLF